MRLVTGPAIHTLNSTFMERPELRERNGGMCLRLSPEELLRLEEAVPASAVAGTRYDEHQMRALDSER